MRISSTLFLIALMGLIGCGSGDELAETTPAGEDSAQGVAPATPPAEAQPTALTGCGWITEAEAGNVFGKPMKYRSNDSGSSNCIVEDAENASGVSVDLAVRDGFGAYDITAQQDKVETLSDLGDRAVWKPDALVNVLVVVKDNRELHIAFSDPSKKTPDMKDKAVALAKVIVGKM